MNVLGIDIQWVGHACFRIRTGQTIYIDPYRISRQEPADIVFITHEHYDHCSTEDLRKVVKPGTIIVAAVECKAKLRDLEKSVDRIVYVVPGQSIAVNQIEVQVVPAYNVNKYKSPGQVFHPVTDEKVGYVLKIDGKRIYHSGDTDVIPEMGRMGGVDIALLPVSGTYVMTPDEAAKAVDMIKPKVAIPMHYGAIVGSVDDATRFKSLVKGSEVAIMQPM
jgi:L-ascorbate metabolism protein UlaG (beta-lactamase superfamily)